mmetsp:Transcript_16355/g.42376  ORF Transcript_16355/g.42376 Transcript_16355/m.42376 type:complete len:219 (-) Transcript_16355:512-1168(-)
MQWRRLASGTASIAHCSLVTTDCRRSASRGYGYAPDARLHGRPTERRNPRLGHDRAGTGRLRVRTAGRQAVSDRTCPGGRVVPGTPSSVQERAVEHGVASGDAALVRVRRLGAQQVARDRIPQLATILVGENSREDSQLGDCREDGGRLGPDERAPDVHWREDPLHEDVRVPLLGTKRLELVHDRLAVDVVASALALRFHHPRVWRGGNVLAQRQRRA